MKRRGWTIILAAALAACGKKEQPPAPLNLSAPEKSSTLGTVARTSAQLPAEAEVTASSGPVQMTLRIYKNKIQAKKEVWEYFRADRALFYQIELKNIGKKRFLARDEMFRRAGHRGAGVMSITLDVIDPDGGPPSYLGDWVEAQPSEYGILPGPGDKEGLALQAKWEKEGVSPQEIAVRFSDRGAAMYKAAHPYEPSGSFWLEPGASTSTLAWVRPDRVREGEHPSVGQFAEFDTLDTRKPGKYRIRAVYNYEYGTDFLRRFKDVRVHEDNVRFATPYIDLEVCP